MWQSHRLLTAKDDLARILTWQESRTISKNLTVQFENIVYQIQTERPTYATLAPHCVCCSAGVRNAAVTVCVDAKQNITLLYKGKSLSYNVFHTCTGVRRKCKQVKQSEVVIAKDLNKTIETKSAPVSHKPAPDHPWRVFPISKKAEMLPPRGGDISALEIR